MLLCKIQFLNYFTFIAVSWICVTFALEILNYLISSKFKLKKKKLVCDIELLTRRFKLCLSTSSIVVPMQQVEKLSYWR